MSGREVVQVRPIHATDSEKILYFRCASLVFFCTFLFSTSFLSAYAETPDKIVIPIRSFGNVACTGGVGNVLLTGFYTNGDTSYKVIFLKALLYDKNGHILATGYGNISDINPHMSKVFHAVIRFSGDFSSCTVQADNAIPR